ncbi:helix-turn-helix transcriptional regulator [Hyphomicrobium sp. CS1BSMeth3]|uniref:helix-turn-helix domain-containing protein n=1 Tax=Hyphomicrobium sp. CS1BSMeth3 TaxID=1892844 RepID=UPI0011608F72|nr:helix-turn-helix transcriptional regulator [Hyphomicrobium sp. CS1BSMeth3]
MSRSTPSLNKAAMREYNRAMFRSMFVSLFWAIVSDLKDRDRFRMKMLADAVGKDKSIVSRWFSGHYPNWELNTIADISSALGISLEIKATHKETGAVYTPAGKINVAAVERPIATALVAGRPRDNDDDYVKVDEVKPAPRQSITKAFMYEAA